MSRRKKLEPGCVGGIFCPVEGHVVTRHRADGRWRISHVPLTQGQWKTLLERHLRERADSKEIDR